MQSDVVTSNKEGNNKMIEYNQCCALVEVVPDEE